MSPTTTSATTLLGSTFLPGFLANSSRNIRQSLHAVGSVPLAMSNKGNVKCHAMHEGFSLRNLKLKRRVQCTFTNELMNINKTKSATKGPSKAHHRMTEVSL